VAPAIFGVLAKQVGFGGVFIAGAVASAAGFVLLLAWTVRSRSSRPATLRT
jgi:hypothetical protein